MQLVFSIQLVQIFLPQIWHSDEDNTMNDEKTSELDVDGWEVWGLLVFTKNYLFGRHADAVIPMTITGCRLPLEVTASSDTIASVTLILRFVYLLDVAELWQDCHLL